MIQRATTADSVLDRITQPIVERFHPRLIILFGSRARGDAHEYSDYDILVELDGEVNRDECWTALHDAIGRIVPSVNFFIRSAGQFDAEADDPGTVDYDAAREGILLYAAEHVTPPGPRAGPATRVRESAENVPPHSVGKWVKSAEADVLDLENNLASATPSWAGTCFHAQQAAEKYLKAVVVSRMQKPIRTHELDVLANQIRELGLELPDFTAEFKLLFQYGQEARYPGIVEIPDEEAGRRTVEAGRRVVESAKRLLPEME
jgi:HEPN domain-containing protein/predicted nucleotidyltransferase